MTAPRPTAESMLLSGKTLVAALFFDCDACAAAPVLEPPELDPLDPELTRTEKNVSLSSQNVTQRVTDLLQSGGSWSYRSTQCTHQSPSSPGTDKQAGS